eukprot:12433155-Alexandrium_andersonii.AAC.1
MSASLVGSEMCIRDSRSPSPVRQGRYPKDKYPQGVIDRYPTVFTDRYSTAMQTRNATPKDTH